MMAPKIVSDTTKAIENASFLVVDDDRFFRSLIKTTLMQLGGYHIKDASSAVEALEQLKESTFDVLLLDHEMPGVTGLELARLIRKGNEGVLDPQIPIIIITGNTEERTVKEAKLSGVNEYLIKPISPAALEKRLAKILKTKAAQNSAT